MQAPLSAEQHERVAANAAEVKRLMPELVPTIRALHAAGMIDGWRSVRQIGAELAKEPSAISMDRIVITTRKQREEEEKRNGRR